MKIVRDYGSSDLCAVLAVFQCSVREVASRDYSPAQIAAWAPEHLDRERWGARLEEAGVFVYECDGAVVGFIRIEERGYVDLLYVHAQFQGQGVAQALMERAVDWALQRHVRRLTSDVSLTARRFFERAGFHVVRSQHVEHRGIVFQNFHMERDMDAAPEAVGNASLPPASA